MWQIGRGRLRFLGVFLVFCLAFSFTCLATGFWLPALSTAFAAAGVLQNVVRIDVDRAGVSMHYLLLVHRNVPWHGVTDVRDDGTFFGGTVLERRRGWKVVLPEELRRADLVAVRDGTPYPSQQR